MRIVGLTGGIATGKSTVSSTLQQQNVALIDCDKIAHAVVKKGRWGYKRVVEAFGEDILQPNGELDRSALGSIVFSDRSARQKLNKATHLPVFIEIFRQILVYWLKFCPVVVVDMPLLFETKSHKLAGMNILVACERDIQVDRLMKRDACTREQAEAKVSSQMSLDEKRRLSDVVIDNNGSREETKHQTLAVLRRLRQHSWLHQVGLGPGAVLAIAAGALKLLAWRQGL